MEREIYTYKSLIDITKGKNLKDKLNDTAEFLYRKYNVKINFCEVFGNRWSFYAGDNDLITIQKRIKITDKIGMIIGENNLDECIWDEIIVNIKRII